jgi:hypothetical protein
LIENNRLLLAVDGPDDAKFGQRRLSGFNPADAFDVLAVMFTENPAILEEEAGLGRIICRQGATALKMDHFGSGSYPA